MLSRAGAASACEAPSTSYGPTTSSLQSLRQRGAAGRTPTHRCQLRARASAERLGVASSDKVDLVLSSGFLAFANHSGFLQAVEETGLRVAGVMGTSAGALAGSLYCAGYSPQQVAAQLSRDPPISLLRLSFAPWKGGILSLQPVVERLRDLLPPTFEDLNKEFAVGVVTADGQHKIIDSGPLPEAVAASAAIPFLFQSIDIPGSSPNPFKDGGVVDRVGLRAWRDRRHAQLKAKGGRGSIPPALVHVISRSSPFSGFDDVRSVGEPNVVVVHSPKAAANLWSLGEFEDAMNASLRRARPVLVEAMASSSLGSASPSARNAGSSSASSSGARMGSDQRSPDRKRFVGTA